MRLVYATDKIDVTDWNSVFLAGPTPRDPSVPSWRPEAIQLFSDMKFDGSLYIPEPQDGKYSHDYEDQGWIRLVGEGRRLRACLQPEDLGDLVGGELVRHG